MVYKLTTLTHRFSSKLVLAIAIAALSFSLSASSATPSAKTGFQRDSALLYFKTDGRVLYDYYKSNNTQLSAILDLAQKHSKSLQNGLSHINIISYIKESQIDQPAAINNASIQASVVRAQFKTRFNIPHTAITFYIDTTQNLSNAVRVDYINTPVPLYSNSNIFYTESTSQQAVIAQVSKYRPSVPYTNYFMRLSKLNPNYNSLGKLSTLDNQQLPNVAKYDAQTETTIIKEIQQSMPATPEPTPLPIAETPQQSPAPITTQPIITEQPIQPTKIAPEKITRGTDVFGLKTNLLFWAAAIPNLQMEFYAGQRISINVEGAYTWGWFLPTDKAYYGWNTSAEMRVWMKGQKQFTGHFVGAFGGAGQYDFKFSQLGFQGDFFQAGVTYGYLLPISNNFFMEFSLGVGVIGYSQTNYQNIDGRNVSVEKLPYKHFFGPNKANVSILWRF